MSKPLDFIAGTIGRVKDHINRENIKLDNLRTIVIDEADQMLAMGKRDDVEFVIKAVKEKAEKVQICLFSATIPEWINEIASENMQEDLVKIDMTVEASNRANKKIKHMMLEVRYDQIIKTIKPLL